MHQAYVKALQLLPRFLPAQEQEFSYDDTYQSASITTTPQYRFLVLQICNPTLQKVTTTRHSDQPTNS